MTTQEFEGKKMKIFAWGGLAYSVPFYIARFVLHLNLELIGAIALTCIVFQIMSWLLGYLTQLNGKIYANNQLLKKAKMLAKEGKNILDNDDDYLS